MEEATELEEGEACYSKEEDGNTGTDPNIALSYIDERIQNVLGHFQKDFEGGVSAENLGAKFGGYGSFLPTYERSTSIQSHPKTLQGNYSTPRSPDNLPMEGATQSCMAPSNGPPPVRLVTAPCSAQLPRISRVPSVDVSVKQDSCLASGQAPEKFPLKHKTPNKSANLTGQRKLKFRIKVGSDNTVRKNTAIYSGLGLDNSLSSSPGSSPEKSGGMPSEYRENREESPTSILQIMSLPILLSPLHDSLLCLITKERLLSDSKPLSVLKGSQEHSAMLVDESASKVGDGEVLKEKKTRLVGRSERLVENKHGNGMDVENGIAILSEKKVEIDASEGKGFFSNDLKLMPTSNSVCDVGDSTKGTDWVNEISREANNEGVKGTLSSPDIAKEESLESISGQDSGKSEKQNAKSSSVENFWECREANHYRDVSVHPRDDRRCKRNKTSAPLKADSDASKRKIDVNVGAGNPSKQKVGQNSISHEQDDIKMPYRREKALFEGKKKSKGFQSNGKLAADLAEESLRVGLCAAPKDKSTDGVYPCKSKMHKSQKGIGEVRYNYKDFSGGTYLKQTDKRMDQVERPSGNRTKDSNLDYVEKEWTASFDKSKERSNGKKVDNQSMSNVSFKEAPNAGPPPMENGLTSQMVPAAAAPVVIEDNWVCCDRCQKWRLLPFGTKPEQLPEKWLCSMLNWLPGMNRCDISEEETTKALNALYQLPGSENENNLLNRANGTASGVTLADVRYLDQNHWNLSSHAMPNREKKKHKTKEIQNGNSSSGLIQISNSTKNHCQESMKGRSLNGMNQPLSESSLMRKHLSKSRDLAVTKHVQKHKVKHTNEGDAKQTKTKSKREADQFGYGASKKIKTEGVYCTDKSWNSEHGGDFGRVSLTSSAGFPAKATGKDMQKYKGECDYKDNKYAAKLLVSVKKLGDQAQVSSDGGSSDLKTCDRRDISVKKRKLKDWQDNNQNHVETFKTTCYISQDSKVFVKEDSIDSEFRKEKKSRKSKTEGKESSTSKGNDRSNKKGRVQIVSLSSRDHPIDGMEEVRNIEKDRKLGKHRGKIASPRTLDGVDLLKRDLGSGQDSAAATSSSSKVSGSHKSRFNFQEVKGSPVESVSSSPLRTSNRDKLTPARREILGKDDATNGGLSVMGNPRRCWDEKGNSESNQTGTIRKENVSNVLRHKSSEFSPLDYRDENVNHKYSGNARPSSEFGVGYLVNGDADTVEQHGRYSSDMHAVEHCYNVDRVNKNNFLDNALFPQKSHKGSSSQSKNKDRSSTSDFDRDKVKVCDPMGEQEELYPKKNLTYESEINPHQFKQCHETLSNVKHSFSDKGSIKTSQDHKNHVSKKNSLGKGSSDSRKEKFREQGGSDMKLGAPCFKNGNVTQQEKLIQDFEDETSQFLANKIDPIKIKMGVGKSQLSMHCKRMKETLANGVQPIPGSQKGGVLNVLPVDASGDADVPKALKQPENAGNQNGAHHMLEHLTLNQHGARDFNVPSPMRKDSSNLTANKIDPIKIKMGVGKSQSIMHCEGMKEPLANGVQPIPGSQKGGVLNVLPVDASGDADVPKALKQPENAGNQNGAHHMLEHLTLNQHVARDFNVPSPVRKDSSNLTASSALKEAKDLRDHADYLKNSGFGFESNEQYFQAALKFLHAASILETCNSDSGNHGEMTQVQLYSTAAKLCEFCAHEYESHRDMAAAALAYKCIEVAYMRIVYYKHFTTNRDRHELQATLQTVLQGESPSSSASDVDNLNNQATVDKAALSKGSGSHVAGHHVIVARHRPKFIRLLDFTQEVNLAMEASRKSQNAFGAANVNLKEAHNGEGITFVKRVIDFSFQDVDELIRLVRLAMEAISRSGFCGSRD
ncbi:hypothetical protein L1049_016906 [Liquidambar formosana]|uniref:CW-type domain-containing protein n=1 Tax=Liquidambar formosana TaxID=63359 RepID=A0AAP0S225_LIQFO